MERRGEGIFCVVLCVFGISHIPSLDRDLGEQRVQGATGVVNGNAEAERINVRSRGEGKVNLAGGFL